MSEYVVAGKGAYEAREARKITYMGVVTGPDSDKYTRFLESEAACGVTEAIIRLTNYGYSLRYASGINGFGLIASARNGTLNGSYEDALEYAEKWCSESPDNRYVSFYGKVPK
jgi:hypothetical protein